MELPVTGAGGAGSATAKSQANAILFRQNVSKASTPLMVAAANGRRISEATLSVRKGGEMPVDYLTMKLSDLVVSSYRTAASTPDAPVDEFTLTFGKVEYSYMPQSATGALAPPLTGTWDFKTNTRRLAVRSPSAWRLGADRLSGGRRGGPAVHAPRPGPRAAG